MTQDLHSEVAETVLTIASFLSKEGDARDL